MTLDPHTAVLAVTTLGAGWLMALAGVQKSALELRRKRRVCPSCGRQLKQHAACSCSAAE